MCPWTLPKVCRFSSSLDVSVADRPALTIAPCSSSTSTSLDMAWFFAEHGTGAPVAALVVPATSLAVAVKAVCHSITLPPSQGTVMQLGSAPATQVSDRLLFGMAHSLACADQSQLAAQ